MKKPDHPKSTKPQPAEQKSVSVRWGLVYGEWILLGLAVLAAALLFRDYGMGWDSAGQAMYGENTLNYFLSGFKDQAYFTALPASVYYGTLFDLPSAALHRMLGLNPYTLRSLLTALCAIGTVPAVIRIGRHFGSERLALFSGLALLLMPQFFGQGFINPKDIPLACAVAWTVLAICRVAGNGDTSWKALLGLGVACGITLGIRVSAVFIFVFLAAALAARFGQSAVQRGFRAALPAKPEWRRLARRILAAGVLMWTVMVIAWPYAYQNLLLNPIRAVRVGLNFIYSYPVLFKGEFVESTNLPASYLPVYFSLILPLPLLALLGVGTLGATLALIRRWRERAAIALFTVLFWVGFPLAYVVLTRPNIYDGVRHFIFVLPAMALLIGWAADALATFLARFWGRATMTVILSALFVSAAVPLGRWHPYQYAYLNALAGNRATLHERFETDYWATSYKAAAEWLNQQQRKRSTPLRVLVAATPLSYPCFVHFLDPRIQSYRYTGEKPLDALPPGIDYYAGTVRYAWNRLLKNSPVVWEERRDGVLFCVIRGDPATNP